MNEPAGFQTAKINRTQRPTGDGGADQGVSSRQGGQNDPWGAPANAGSASGWGNGAEGAEPPF